MNMQDVLYILENEQKRKDFILRLKQAGEISEAFQAQRYAMSSLRVNKPPREVNQTTILSHAFQYSDGMEAFQNFRLVSTSWKVAVENTKFHTPHVHNLLFQIVEMFEQGEYPILYHKLLQNLTTYPPLDDHFFPFDQEWLSNNFNPIAKLVCKNMKGLKSIQIENNFDVISDEIYENFLTEFLPNSKNTLCDLHVPKLFLPNVCFPNLTTLSVNNLNLSFEIFKTQFEQILKNMPDLKVIKIWHIDPPVTQIIRDYLISNYAEQCLISIEVYGINTQFPVKIICFSDFCDLVDCCQFKSSLNYVQFIIDATNPDEADWNYFKNNIYDFSKLKGIAFCGTGFGDSMEESDFYKPETNVDPELETFYNIWPDRIQFLKSHGIQILNQKEFDSKQAELSNNLKWAFHFAEN